MEPFLSPQTTVLWPELDGEASGGVPWMMTEDVTQRCLLGGRERCIMGVVTGGMPFSTVIFQQIYSKIDRASWI